MTRSTEEESKLLNLSAALSCLTTQLCIQYTVCYPISHKLYVLSAAVTVFPVSGAGTSQSHCLFSHNLAMGNVGKTMHEIVR